MELHTASLIYFSPTGSTRKIITAVVRGMGLDSTQEIDLTIPGVRGATHPILQGEVVLIALPVYGMGIPKLIYPYLSHLKSRCQPAVLITIYGNVDEGVALQQIFRLAEQAGLNVIAAASFVAEHTLSTAQTPLAHGRPDSADLYQAEAFGQTVGEKLRAADQASEIRLNLPRPQNPLLRHVLPRLVSAVPRNDGVKRFTQTPVVDPARCTHCKICVKHCPVAAIDPATLAIAESRCFHCFSCVKRCPHRARQIAYRLPSFVARFMMLKTKVARQPKVYL